MISGNRGNHILELKETPFSTAEGRFFVMKRASLKFDKTPPLSANNSFHSPLHSERGWGRGFPLSANNGFHSPLHSERGWGRGCSWAGGEASFRKKEAFGGTHPLLRRGLGRLSSPILKYPLCMRKTQFYVYLCSLN